VSGRVTGNRHRFTRLREGRDKQTGAGQQKECNVFHAETEK
jgi:hypothetical protein